MYFLLQGGSLHGKFVDATPFSDSLRKANGEAGSESSSLVDELGSMLTSYGFNYHGVEVLYSGFYGTELTCEIFIGPVYYQRLRHMVSDKFQVTFPIYNYVNRARAYFIFIFCLRYKVCNSRHMFLF